MKRFNLIFAVVVVTAFVSAFIVERSRSRDAPLPDYAAPRKEVLDPLDAPRGEHTLTGTIVTHAGRPAAAVFVHLRLVEGDLLVADPMYYQTTDEDGRFELFNLPAGRFEVVLLSTGVPNTQRDFTIPEGGPDGEVRWTLPEPHPELPELPEIVRADLVGALVLPEGIAENRSLEGYEVVVSPAEGVDPWTGAFEQRAVTGASGDFRVEGLVLAKYVIRVLPPWARGGSWPFLAAEGTAYDHEVPDRDHPLPIVLDCGEVAGALADGDGRPIEGALVRISEEGRRERFWPVRGTGEDGGFLVRDLPPGRYVLRVDTGGVVREVEVEVESGQRSEATFAPIDLRR